MGREPEATGWGIHKEDFYSWRVCGGEFKKNQERKLPSKVTAMKRTVKKRRSRWRSVEDLEH